MKAYPCNPALNDKWQGMDLRDYFAAQAMNGYLSRVAANPIGKEQMCDVMQCDTNAQAITKSSYMFADAMLEARKEIK